MFDKLIDVLLGVWEWLIPFFVVQPYERALVTQTGKFRREVGPGFWLCVPFGIDDIKKETVVRQTSYLEVQSVTSYDGIAVSLRAIIVYEIVNLQCYLLQIDDGESDVQNLCYGAITEEAQSIKWERIYTSAFDQYATQACKEISKSAGVKILNVVFADKTKARTIRLWND